MGNVTEIIEQIQSAEVPVTRQLFSLVYDQLKRLAHQQIRKEKPGLTLQATALVNEAFLKLVESKKICWKDRNHFFRSASRAMRHILIDQARAKSRIKRGSGERPISLDENLATQQEKNHQVLELEAALKELELVAPVRATLVELHFFGGLTIKQCAEVLGFSNSTAERHWRFAKAWLRKQMAT